MKIFIEKENKTIEKKYYGNLLGLLRSLDINPETVIVTRNGELLTDDEILEENDEIKVINVVSAG